MASQDPLAIAAFARASNTLVGWWKSGDRTTPEAARDVLAPVSGTIDRHSRELQALFEALPPTSIVLDDYVRFLYHIGERSLPEAFVRVADALRRGDAQRMLGKANSIFLLEVLCSTTSTDARWS